MNGDVRGCPVGQILTCERRLGIHERRGELQCRMIVSVEQTGWLASKSEAYHKDATRALEPTR